MNNNRGYFGIGIINGKTNVNLGTLWRTANLFNVSFIFTIGKRYIKQASDTMVTNRHIPLFEYNNWKDFKNTIPKNCKVITIELNKKSIPIENFKHPQRAIYLLGAEDNGIPEEILNKCDEIIQLPGKHSMNVAVAGSIVIYDRYVKNLK
jgi:tRNA G18 (ribose-2'-O)-methylase SpoU